MEAGADQALAVVPGAPSIAPDLSGIPNINPLTGLSTDYLNHFTEAVMALEMLPMMPDFLPDLEAWTPRTYCEHFAASHFSHRDVVIAAYYDAPAKVRDDLDAASDMLNTVLLETRDAVVAQRSAPAAGELAKRAAAWLKPLMAGVGAVINGATSGVDQNRDCTQDAIDALFAR